MRILLFSVRFLSFVYEFLVFGLFPETRSFILLGKLSYYSFCREKNYSVSKFSLKWFLFFCFFVFFLIIFIYLVFFFGMFVNYSWITPGTVVLDNPFTFTFGLTLWC